MTSPIDENGTATVSGDISDSDAADTFTLTVDWGDGLVPQVFTYPAGASSFSVSHQYPDDNPTATSSDTYPITLTLNDSGGGSDNDATTVTVNNVAPSLSGIVVNPATIVVGSPTNAGESVIDAGALDPHTVVINWGDGSADTTLNLVVGVLTFSSTHQYSAAGTFNIGITAADDDGGVANGSASVTVNPAVVTPNAPTNLTASPVSKTQINLVWTDSANNETGFAIERCTAKGKNCSVVEIAQTGADAAAFSDTGLNGNTAYRYRVLAFNGDGSSAYTNIASAKTLRK